MMIVMKEFVNHPVVKSWLITMAVAVPTMYLFIDEDTGQGVAAIYAISLLSLAGFLLVHFQDQQQGRSR